LRRFTDQAAGMRAYRGELAQAFYRFAPHKWARKAEADADRHGKPRIDASWLAA